MSTQCNGKTAPKAMRHQPRRSAGRSRPQEDAAGCLSLAIALEAHEPRHKPYFASSRHADFQELLVSSIFIRRGEPL
jgi:hypothetical protein